MQDLLADVQALICSRDRVSQVGGFLAYGVDALAELVLGPAFFGGKIEEVALFAVEHFESFVILRTQVGGQASFGGDGRVYAFAHGEQPLRIDYQHVAVVAGDGFLNDVDRDVRLVAQTLLSAAAEPVEVFAAVADRSLYDEAVLAARAPDRALEVVIVRPLACARAAVCVEDALYAIEQFLAHERFMPSGIGDAFVHDDAFVVRVAQHDPQTLVRDRAGWPFGVAGHA